MSMLINYVKSFARNDEGQDLLEYALLVALIALDRDSRGHPGRTERVRRSSPTSRSSSAARRKRTETKGAGARCAGPASSRRHEA